ncbi:shikimate kinase [Polaribacter batillariae]|uniref:Shikimate kinase n=1 Tax=Polaribacter batillariae TaxID=2808900 RepID=A0ABX7SYE9_9FLAO|nr:shikimate kinase [Polaribacter batillariae]QTD37829.1 shikimate kinase [Polaribacter batillariae]
MKIVLLGYMASGKSTIGKKLAKKLYLNFIDLDEYISEKEKMSISEIFSTKGEIYFRKIEHEYLKEILNSDEKIVLSLGGGTPCYANNMDVILRSNAKSIYIKASINTLVERLLKEKSKRPLVANLENEKITEFVAKHLFERRFFYEQANYSVATDGRDVSEIVTELRILLH